MPIEKIIFLDFDGVLNTEYYQAQLLRQGRSCKDENGMFFDPEAVAQLKRVVDETNADIVIESSWKYIGLEAMRRLWMSRAMPGQLIGMTSSSVSDEWLLNSDLEDFDS
uniref:HAD domain-containing protein n=2 Tax=Bacteroidales TaxID=171549 RepID=UPI002FD91380